MIARGDYLLSQMYERTACSKSRVNESIKFFMPWNTQYQYTLESCLMIVSEMLTQAQSNGSNPRFEIMTLHQKQHIIGKFLWKSMLWSRTENGDLRPKTTESFLLLCYIPIGQKILLALPWKYIPDPPTSHCFSCNHSRPSHSSLILFLNTVYWGSLLNGPPLIPGPALCGFLLHSGGKATAAAGAQVPILSPVTSQNSLLQCTDCSSPVFPAHLRVFALALPLGLDHSSS